MLLKFIIINSRMQVFAAIFSIGCKFNTVVVLEIEGMRYLNCSKGLLLLKEVNK